MNITIDKTISYEVSKIVISDITINKIGNGLIFMIPFEWHDSKGNILSRSMKRYTTIELTQLATSLGLSFTPFVSMLNGILSNDKINLRLDLRDQTNIKAMVLQKIDNKFTQIKLEGSTFTSAIAPITVENLLQIITLISNNLTS